VKNSEIWRIRNLVTWGFGDLVMEARGMSGGDRVDRALVELTNHQITKSPNLEIH
jgi:hypothetical protein